jgi:hypothetical protein
VISLGGLGRGSAFFIPAVGGCCAWAGCSGGVHWVGGCCAWAGLAEGRRSSSQRRLSGRPLVAAKLGAKTLEPQRSLGLGRVARPKVGDAGALGMRAVGGAQQPQCLPRPSVYSCGRERGRAVLSPSTTAPLHLGRSSPPARFNPSARSGLAWGLWLAAPALGPTADG